MSSTPPPIQPGDNRPPQQQQQYAEYHRSLPPGMPVNGSSKKLKAMLKAHTNLTWHFLGMLLSLILVLVVAAAADSPVLAIGLSVLVIIASCYFGIRIANDLVEPLGMQKSHAMLLGIGLVLLIPVTGIVGYVIVQIILSTQMNAYQPKKGCLGGASTKAYRERIKELEAVGY